MSGKRPSVDWALFAAFAASVATALVWIYLDNLRFNAYNASIYDLGLSFEDLYGVMHGGLYATATNVRPIFLNKLIYLPLGFIFYFDPSFRLMFILQAAFLSFGSTVVYLIASKLTGSRIASLVFSLCYALYYPLSGVYWFDFHFMAFFPTSFLLGFYFYLKGRNALSVTFFALAAMTDYISPVIILFTALYLFLAGKSGKLEVMYRYRVPAAIALISSLLLISIFLYFGASYTLSYAHSNIHNGFTQQAATLQQKYFFVPYLLISLALLPLAAPELLLLASPFVVLALFNNYTPYLDTVGFQYPALYSAQLFVSAVYGYRRIKGSGKFSKLSRPALAAVLAVTVLLFVSVSPAGNVATGIGQKNLPGQILAGVDSNSGFSSQIAYTAYDSSLTGLIAEIPRGSSVMVQNNMPALVYGYNWSLPFQTDIHAVSPEYIITDPYSSSFTGLLPERSNNYTMESAFNYYYGTGRYGVLGDTYGEILLKKGYSGNPVLYLPYRSTFSPSVFHVASNSTFRNGTAIIGPVTNGSYGWYGPYTTLAPGSYTAEFNMSAGSVPADGNFVLQVDFTPSGSINQKILAWYNVTAAGINPYSSLGLKLNFTLASYTGLVEFRCVDMHYAGEIGLAGITVSQTLPALY